MDERLKPLPDQPDHMRRDRQRQQRGAQPRRRRAKIGVASAVSQCRKEQSRQQEYRPHLVSSDADAAKPNSTAQPIRRVSSERMKAQVVSAHSGTSAALWSSFKLTKL
jgi:hypothetical protein